MGEAQWGADAAVLGGLGNGWAGLALPRVDVALPAAQRLARHRCGTLALIGWLWPSAAAPPATRSTSTSTPA